MSFVCKVATIDTSVKPLSFLLQVYVLDTVLMSISVVFLVATVGVYLSDGALRTCDTGRCIVAVASALAASFTLLMLTKHHLQAFGGAVCVLSGEDARLLGHKSFYCYGRARHLFVK